MFKYRIYFFFSLPFPEAVCAATEHVKFYGTDSMLLTVVPDPAVKRDILHSFTALDELIRWICACITAIHAGEVCTKTGSHSLTKGRRILLERGSPVIAARVFADRTALRKMARKTMSMQVHFQCRHPQHKKCRGFGCRGTEQALRKRDQSHSWQSQ